MKTKLFLLSVALIAFTFSSCKKGDTGAQGPAGPAGANGNNGSANITNTTFTATPGTWNTSNAPWYFINVAVSAITNADVDLVMVYVQFSGSTWWAIPASNLITTGDNFQFDVSTGVVQLWYNYTAAPTGTWNFRIVTIPPAVAHANPDVRYSNYQEVKKRFNLKD